MAEAAPVAAAKPKVTLFWWVIHYSMHIRATRADTAIRPTRLEKSRAQRIVWLLQECKDIDLEIETFKRGSDMLAGPELKKKHPLGKSPTISIAIPGRAEPLVIAESGTLVEYLCDYFAQHLVPKRFPEGKDGQIGAEREEWLRFRFYMHYAEGSLMTMLLLGLFVDRKSNFLRSNVTGTNRVVCLRNQASASALFHQARHSGYRDSC